MFFQCTVPSGPPSNTTGMVLNSTHIYLTWDPPTPDKLNGVIQGYRINITELETGEMSQYTAGADATNATIGPLHPHYGYNFSIVAFTIVGNGPITFVVIRTAEAGKSIIALTECLASHNFTFCSTFQCSWCIQCNSIGSNFDLFVLESPSPRRPE